MKENGQSSNNVPSLQTLACQVEHTPGNNLLHQFVLDDSHSGHSYNKSREVRMNVVLTSLYDPQVPVNALNFRGYSALQLAVLNNNALMVKNLLACFKTLINANVKDKFGETPLYAAAKSGYYKIVKELLKVPGILVNEKCGDNNYTPLHIAVECGRDGIVKQLLNDPRILINEECGPNKYTPLFIAAMKGRANIVKELLKFPGLKINKKCNDREYTPLHIAVEMCHFNIVKQLIKVPDIYVNEKLSGDMCNYTPLHIAVIMGHYSLVKKLLKAPGIQINKKSGVDYTPLQIAMEKDYDDIVQELLKVHF